MDDQNPSGDRAEPDVGFSLDSGDSGVPDVGFALNSAAAAGPVSPESAAAHSVPADRPTVIAPETAGRTAVEDDSADTEPAGAYEPGLGAVTAAVSPEPADETPVSSSSPDDAEADDGAAEDDPEEQRSRELAYELARTLARAAPDGWTRLDAVFALTATESAARVFYAAADRVVEAIPTEAVLSVARAQRDSTAPLDDGPWWRMLLGLTVDGQVEVEYDYGDEPFPDEQLFSPAAYRADLEAYPRERIPVWLAAHIDDGNQVRDAGQAARQATLDRSAGIAAEASIDDLPPLDVLWARWVTLAAVFVASGSELGPRMTPSQGRFEGATHSGSTLCRLPGGRAVLSGGLWEAPVLDAAYNDGDDLPELYRGAPFWVADQVLDPRAARGLLSFCYWWEGNGWYRGESPSPAEFARALPGVWTTDVVIDLIVRQLSGDDEPEDESRTAAVALVAAAQDAAVDRELIGDLLGADGDFDADGAYYQFFLGGLTVPELAAAAGPR